ncbi:MAG: OmpA family protein [Flavobacteriaceae bacterium]|nr:OmpA family protein [Flavobacteriaceae bacterium]
MKKILFNLVLVLLVNNISAQKNKLKKANEKYDSYSYSTAIDRYLDVLDSGYVSEELLEKLGDSYYYLGDYSKSMKYYKQLHDLSGDNMKTKYFLKYSQVLKTTGDYTKANEFYSIYIKRINSNKDSSYIDYYEETINLDPGRYSKQYLSVNSKYSEYGVFTRGNDFYFTSNRLVTKFNNKMNAWDSKPFFNIYKADYNQNDKTFTNIKLLKGELNSNSHESSPVVTKDGKTMYFTRSSNDFRTKKNKKGGRLQIYKATNVNEKWVNIESVSINKKGYSNAHPVLSKDEKTMYFASDMPGTIGGADIFSVAINDGVFGEPKNMGTRINTQGRETFPYITTQDELYFSSDGHFGIGGLDVYYVDLNDVDLQLFNIGKPINSKNDDFAFSINYKGLGFFTNNEKGIDNINSFLEKESIKEFLKTNIKVIVKNKKTGELLNNLIVTVSNTRGGIIETNNTKVNGIEHTYFYRKYKKYFIKVEKDGFYTTDSLVTMANKKENIITINLSESENIIAKKDIVTEELIDNIYFKFDSSKVLEIYFLEIEKVISIVKEKNKNIEILAYTDSRGTDKYNLKLSKKRALSVIKYLIDKGIDKDKIRYKGLGIDRFNEDSCNGNVDCLKDIYRLNRRVEFSITDQ